MQRTRDGGFVAVMSKPIPLFGVYGEDVFVDQANVVCILPFRKSVGSEQMSGLASRRVAACRRRSPQSAKSRNSIGQGLFGS